jgi:hypothetical protein
VTWVGFATRHLLIPSPNRMDLWLRSSERDVDRWDDWILVILFVALRYLRFHCGPLLWIDRESGSIGIKPFCSLQ